MFQVGVDCEEISRFRRLSYGKNKRFYQKIFTPPEIEYCMSYKDPYPRFAVRFAAKEATIKAFNNIARFFYTDIEVQKDGGEQPKIRLIKNKFKGMNRFDISLSLTHSNSYAIAFVVAIDKKSDIKEANRILRRSASYAKRRIGR